MSNAYNTLKSTQIIGSNNISGYSLDVSGQSYFHNGNVVCDNYVICNQTSFSGSQLITKNYADTTYLGATSGLLTNNNTWSGTNLFNQSVTISNNLVFSGASQIASDLIVSGNVDISQINHSSILKLQNGSGNIQIGVGSTPTRKLEVNGNALITNDLTINGSTVINNDLLLYGGSLSTTQNITATGNLTCNNVTASNNIVANTISHSTSIYIQPVSGNTCIGNPGSVAPSTTLRVAGSLQVDGVSTFSGLINAPYLMPIGSILTHSVSSNITGYLLCDGSWVSRSTYAGLFITIGTTFGSGNGSTTFALPDYRGMFLRGYGEIPNISNPSGTYQSNNIGTYQDARTKTHQHYAPINPNTYYGASTNTTPVLQTVSVNQPTITLPNQNVNLGSYTLGLGILGNFSIPLGNFTVSLGSIIVPSSLSTTYTTVDNGLNTSTFATQTGSSTDGITSGETRPINMSVYYHIKY